MQQFEISVINELTDFLSLILQRRNASCLLSALMHLFETKKMHKLSTMQLFEVSVINELTVFVSLTLQLSLMQC